MAKFGFDVLLIDRKRQNFGGDCLHTGCIPSKALIHVTDILKKAKDAEAYGLKTLGRLMSGKYAGALFNKIYSYPVQTRVHKTALIEELSKASHRSSKRC